MTPSARIAAAIDILDTVLTGVPAEQALTKWARRSRFAGSKDRAAIRDHVFDALRCKLSFAALGGAMTGRGLMIGYVRSNAGDPDALFTGDGYGAPALSNTEKSAGRDPETDAERMNLPDWLVPVFRDALKDSAEQTARALCQRGPVMLRVNLQAGGIAEAIAALAEDGVVAAAHPIADTALMVSEGARRVRLSAAFADGLVELQDGASQAVVAALPLRDGLKTLDYCAGGGGKILAMSGRAKVNAFAFDQNAARMQDLPLRATRANVQVRILQQDELAIMGPYDLVLCDVPCSGSGAWRRSPDGKWALTQEKLHELNALQDDILDESARLVAPNGTLAYATCSVLLAENNARVQAFLTRHPDWACTDEHVFSVSDGGDGFYTAHLTRVP